MAQSDVVLQDGSLRLRPVTLPDDVALGVPWYRDPEVLRLSEGEGTPPYDAAMVERMWRAMVARCEVYIIETLTPDGWRAIGDASICREGGVPIVIGEAAYRSRGLGRRVLRLLIERARALGWPRLFVKGVYTDNERSRRLYEGAGFRPCGQTRDDDGHPIWQFALPLA